VLKNMNGSQQGIDIKTNFAMFIYWKLKFSLQVIMITIYELIAIILVITGILYVFLAGFGKINHRYVELTFGKKMAFKGGPGIALILSALILVHLTMLPYLVAVQQGEAKKLPELKNVEDIEAFLEEEGYTIIAVQAPTAENDDMNSALVVMEKSDGGDQVEKGIVVLATAYPNSDEYKVGLASLTHSYTIVTYSVKKSDYYAFMNGEISYPEFKDRWVVTEETGVALISGVCIRNISINPYSIRRGETVEVGVELICDRNIGPGKWVVEGRPSGLTGIFVKKELELSSQNHSGYPKGTHYLSYSIVVPPEVVVREATVTLELHEGDSFMISKQKKIFVV
jgi:hypothetical protein